MTHVLIVQGGPSNAEQLRLVLQTQTEQLRQELGADSFAVDVALDAASALSQFNATKYDLVLVDASVPGLSTYNLCQRLKKSPNGPDVPILLVVEPTDPVLVARALECGADALIARPYEREDLALRIRTALQNRCASNAEDRVSALLHATFADLVRLHQAHNRCLLELSEATDAARSFAAELERRVRQRTSELLERQELQHQAQKMDVLGDVTGGIAHDFNNILTVVVGNLDSIFSEAIGDPRIKKLSESAIEAAMRGADLTRQLLAFSRKQPLAPRMSNVNAIVSSMVQVLKRILGEKIEIEVDAADSLWPVFVDPDQFQSAINHLSHNARDAMPAGGKLKFKTSNVVLDADYAASNLGVASGDYCMLAVSDTGAGIAPNILARVFEPLFTTKPGPQTAGLGLSMVFGFVKQSGGHVKIESSEGRGTIVRVYLPRAKADQSSQPQYLHEPPPHPPSGDETILLVEDDSEVRRTVAQQLHTLGYRVIEADRAGPALAALDRHADVALLFTDMILPGGIGGKELAREARIVKPDLRVLYTSGYLRGLRADHRLDPGDIFIGKPFRLNDLAEKVREALGQQQYKAAAHG